MRVLSIEDVAEYVLWFLPAPPSCFVFDRNCFYWTTCPWCGVNTDATPFSRIQDDDGYIINCTQPYARLLICTPLIDRGGEPV
mmetsp:Transcript_47835/g.85393  ORF Transcript_47835/g.85393 Transcript_47835/m.85393 type:complete len:83 (-) Transcript_47835:69-317(-)